MTNKINDGGPAFPMLLGNESISADVAGMTLRDCFAAKALAGFASQPPEQFTSLRNVADQAYAIADAMLAARQK